MCINQQDVSDLGVIGWFGGGMVGYCMIWAWNMFFACWIQRIIAWMHGSGR